MGLVRFGRQRTLTSGILSRRARKSGCGTVPSPATHSIYSQVGSLPLSLPPSLSFSLSLSLSLPRSFHCTHSLSFLCAASSDHVARLWLVDRSDPVREYQGHNKAVTALAYNDKRWKNIDLNHHNTCSKFCNTIVYHSFVLYSITILCVCVHCTSYVCVFIWTVCTCC